MTAQPDLTITIVSWNTRELLRGCLLAIQHSQTKATVEIHVVDNASQDGSAEMVETEFPHTRLIANNENLGFAAANNQSWALARGRYWLLLNSDAEVKPGALDALVQFMDAHTRAGLTTARLTNPDGTPQHCAQAIPSIFLTLLESSRLHKLLPSSWQGRLLLGPYWNYRESLRLGWTWGTALIARRTAVESLGPLSEDFFMYGEDLEWCLRMQKHDWEIWYCPEAEVLHYGGQSSAQRWDANGRQQIKMDAIYKAMVRHCGLFYVRLLQTVSLLTVGVEWLLAKARRRPLSALSYMFTYYLSSLKLKGAR